MGRFWFGAALLLLLLLLGIFGGLWIGDTLEPVIGALEAAGDMALSQLPEDSAQRAEEALALWQAHWRAAAAISVHRDMEGIDALFARLKALAQGGDWVTFSACCRDLARQIEALTDAQSFNWWSLL